jgi:hypothetical protein
MDLLITHECWESSSNPVLNDLLHYPLPDIDNTLNDDQIILLKKYVNTILIIVTVPLIIFLSCQLSILPLTTLTVSVNIIFDSH